MSDIRPGLVTASQADRLSELVRQTAEHKRAIERLNRGELRKVPAVVTAYDEATGAYTWYERDFNKNGQSGQKDGGLSGSPAFMPAYGVGDGAIIREFPTPVILRPTVTTPDKGIAWEVIVYCACLPTDGSYSGSANVTVACCPNNQIPSTLYAVVVPTGAPGCLKTVYELTYRGRGTGANLCRVFWRNSPLDVSCGSQLYLLIELICDLCSGVPAWVVKVSCYASCGIGYENSNAWTMRVQCDPFFADNMNDIPMTPTGACPYSAFTFDLFIVE